MKKQEITENRVSIGGEITGIITFPTLKSRVPAVLLLHGFGSHKNEVGNLYKHLTFSLASNGIASLRIDFRGCGESSGDMSDITIQRQVNDALAAYDFVCSLDFVSSDRIGIVGFSLGGAIAIIVASTTNHFCKSMVLWSSVGHLENDFTDSLGKQSFELAKRNGEVEIDLGWRVVRIKKTFFDSLQAYDLIKEIKKYKGALLAIAGSADYSAKYVNSLLSSSKSKMKSAVILDGVDHIFNVFEEETVSKNVIDNTVQWLTLTL